MIFFQEVEHRYFMVLCCLSEFPHVCLSVTQPLCRQCSSHHWINKQQRGHGSCPTGAYSWVWIMRQVKMKPRRGLSLNNASGTGSRNAAGNLESWVERVDFSLWLHSISHLPWFTASAMCLYGFTLTEGSKAEQPAFPRDWTVQWSQDLK